MKDSAQCAGGLYLSAERLCRRPLLAEQQMEAQETPSPPPSSVKTKTSLKQQCFPDSPVLLQNERITD